MVDRGTRFTHALVRAPGPAFVDGLRRIDLGVPSLDVALIQHRRYCEALQASGVTLVELADDPRFADGCFVEDTAILVRSEAMLTRPGAISRRGEVDAIGEALHATGLALSIIEAPGTLDGGDVCVAGDRALIGLSERTNTAGAEQLAAWFAARAIRAELIDIRRLDSILHLKSGLAWLGDGCMIAVEALASHPALADFKRITPVAGDAYAANAVRINDRVLVAAGYPVFAARLEEQGLHTIPLDVGEYAKLDGGLSCLSLRWWA